jgi:phenylacetate-CoA ligase
MSAAGRASPLPLRSDVAGAVWPPVLTGEAATLAALMQQLEASQWLSPSALRERQFDQLAVVAAHHAEHSGQFRRRLAAAGLTAAEVATPDGLARLPLLTRRDIQTAPDLFAETLPPLHGPAVELNTSGSTGEPVHIRRTALNRLDWWAVTMRDHAWHRRNLAGRFCAIRFIERPAVLPDWGTPATLLHRTGPSLGLPMTMAITDQLRLLREFRPTSLLVYPSDLAGLLDHIEAEGTTGLDELADIRTVGEILPADLRARTKAVLGIDIADTYSSQELGYVALQCPESGLYHVMAETCIVELLDHEGRPCAPGGIGRIVVTDLRNFATPLIRYEIRDYAQGAGPCPCGRGLPTLAGIVGRSRNLLVKPDGTRSWPQFGYARYREIAGVIQYQCIQHDLERIEFKLRVERPLDEATEARLRAHIQGALGFPFRLDFTYLDRPIEPGPSGKFEQFISRVTT